MISDHARRILARRERVLGPNSAYLYDDPVQFARGRGVWLYDHEGRKYLDCYNNVPHHAHWHLHVVEAIRRQTALLITNSRYLHDNMLDDAERLTATFHKSLNTTLYTCTSSEANEVALRMAQSVTGAKGLIVADFTYHGDTALVMELATLLPREDGPCLFLRSIPAPGFYHRERGEKMLDEMAARSLRHLEAAIALLRQAGRGVAALLICPIFANEGFPIYPRTFSSVSRARFIRPAAS